MSRPNQNKIATSPSANPLNTAFSQALGGLDTNSLAPGKDAPLPDSKPSKMGRVVLRKETAHRGGKAVIVVHDFPTHHSPVFIENLAKRLRKSCGCGGTVNGREIEIQGDQAPRIRALLESEGFRVAGV